MPKTSGESGSTATRGEATSELRLYNTASRTLETFKPRGDTVTIYTCGPTVYNIPHIGNFAAYTYWDLLVRTLRLHGYAVRRVLNLTDVGHLVSDADDGEDKLEKTARIEGKTPMEIANFYTAIYLDNYARLEFLPPEILARATDYIEADKAAVDLMTKHGFTYEIPDGVYFDTAKFPDYSKFAKLDLGGLKKGARVDFNSQKRNASDFAIWKFIQPGEKHAMRWEYLGRPGYPGWHLECSVIIHETLGDPIDIHTGGIDHIPVHHTNEIAQTFAAYGTSLARYWLHCGFITIDGQKISKSLGNTYSLEDLEKRGFTPMDYKTWLLSGHYQGTRNFTFDSLAAAHVRRHNWRVRIAACYQVSDGKDQPSGSISAQTPQISSKDAAKNEVELQLAKPFSPNFIKILDAVSNNLNSAEAFKLIDELDLTLEDWQNIDALFGLRLIEDTPDISTDKYQLIKDRVAARAAKDFEKSDEIRDQLLADGIALNDAVNGTIWYYLD